MFVWFIQIDSKPKLNVNIMSDLPSTSTPQLAKPSATTRSVVKPSHLIDLIGFTSHQILGAKLPSKRQVLQVFFYNMRFVHLDQNESAKLAIDAVLIFWQQARIPTSRVDVGVKKLLKLYSNWVTIQKVAPSKRSDVRWAQAAAQEFVDGLDDLFDIAAAKALEQINIEEDRQFLILQRQKGRPGCMAGADMNLYAREKRSTERKEKEESRKRKHEESANPPQGT